MQKSQITILPAFLSRAFLTKHRTPCTYVCSLTAHIVLQYVIWYKCLVVLFLLLTFTVICQNCIIQHQNLDLCDCYIRVYYLCTAVKYQTLEDTTENVTPTQDKPTAAGLPSTPQSDHLFNTQQLNIGKQSCVHTVKWTPIIWEIWYQRS